MQNYTSPSTHELSVSRLGLMTVDDIVIEIMNESDIPAMREMIRRNMAAYEEAGSVLASTFRRLETFAELYVAVGSCFIVARDQGRDGLCIGGAGIGPLQGLSPAEGLGEIRDLVVEPTYRGHGIGARLLKRCLDEAKRLGYSRLYLESTPQMEHAQKLFLRFGFRPVTTGASKISKEGVMPCYYLMEHL